MRMAAAAAGETAVRLVGSGVTRTVTMAKPAEVVTIAILCRDAGTPSARASAARYALCTEAVNWEAEMLRRIVTDVQLTGWPVE